MQQLLRVVRGLVYPAVAIFLLWAGYQIIASPHVSQSSGKILAVYDGDLAVQSCNEEIAPDKENQSEQALAGFCKAVKASTNGPKVDLLNVHAETHDQADGRGSGIYQQLASRVARGPVLGVISFLTSPDSPPVVRFCRTMQIPLLLALAANDNLMALPEDTHGIVFRMIPTNGLQARNMAEWLRQQLNMRQQLHPNQGPLRTALFHETNSFGEFLHRQLTHEIQPEIRDNKLIVYNFEVTEQQEFAFLMPQLWCRKTDLVVYLGFAPRALDLLNKLGSYKADLDQVPCKPGKRSRSFDSLTVLLSSGAYQEDLNDINKYPFRFNVFAMLSARPGREKGLKVCASNASQDDEETGASAYGYDSYNLMQRLANQQFRYPSQPIEHPKTGHEFRFTENGELIDKSANRVIDSNIYQPYRLRCSCAGRQL